VLSTSEDASALARKRRREILTSQRTANIIPDFTPSSSIVAATPSAVVSEPLQKKHKVTLADSTTTTAKPTKKPQMKYDPDVPMTKEEAAVWRREQRRKRNRESAAASRQRQRDRIGELEVELDEWKAKYDEIMKRVTEMEQITQKNMTDDLIDSLPFVTTPVLVSPRSTTAVLDIDTTKFVSTSSSAGRVSDSEDDDQHSVTSSSDNEEQHDNKMISRPA
jgi:hypothetical protein